jgi:hypothetical protein
MHVSKPPKIQNQTKNTTREPELKAPRTDLQIGHHIIEAETISQQGSALPEDSARYQLTYQRTINSLSADYQLTINSLSTHYQLTISSLSVHYQLTINSLSTHYQLTINSLSAHYQFTNDGKDFNRKHMRRSACP